MTSDDGVRVRVSAEVAALTRANVLGHLAREMVSIFESDDKVLLQVLRGIRQGFLSKVELVLSDSRGQPVGYLAIRIDWEKHALYVEAGNSSNMFQIDPLQPISAQLSPLLARTAAYLSAVRQRLGIASTSIAYTYRSGYGVKKGENNPMGLVALSDDSRQRLSNVQRGLRLEVNDSKFGELTVEFRCQDPDSA